MPSHPMILIVEDDDRTIELLEAALEHFGAELIFTSDGVECIQIAEEAQPTLILMDLLLPSPSPKGWDVIYNLKNNAQTHHIPIIALSAAGNEGIMRAMKAGADSFMQKPFSMAQFQRTIAQYVATASR